MTLMKWVDSWQRKENIFIADLKFYGFGEGKPSFACEHFLVIDVCFEEIFAIYILNPCHYER